MAETQNDLAQYQTDHDLLILLNERVRALTEAVTNKNADFEARIRILEQHRWLFAGGAIVIATLLPYIIRAIFGI
jgi:hypothetical protein